MVKTFNIDGRQANQRQDEVECSPCATEEGIKAQTKRVSDKLSREEVEEHNATHTSFLSCCDHCRRGTCHGEPHYRGNGLRELDQGTEMSIMDYKNMQFSLTTKRMKIYNFNLSG